MLTMLHVVIKGKITEANQSARRPCGLTTTQLLASLQLCVSVCVREGGSNGEPCRVTQLSALLWRFCRVIHKMLRCHL